MNRRTFLKKLGAMAGVALVAPKALLEAKALTVADVNALKAKADAIPQGVIYGNGRTRFDNQNFGVVAGDSTTAKAWSKSFYNKAKANLYFDKMMGRDKRFPIQITQG